MKKWKGGINDRGRFGENQGSIGEGDSWGGLHGYGESAVGTWLSKNNVETEQGLKAVAVIPCWNEEAHISELVFQTNRLLGMSIVADDSSVNGTAEKAEKSGAYLVRNFGKKGAGANTQAGIDRALLMECDIVVTLDGDGQHDPADIPKLLKPIEEGNADVVVGTRFVTVSGNIIPLYRRFGIRVITWLYNFGRRDKLTDVQCCFRAFSRKALDAISITESGFAFSVETVIKARGLGFRVVEVPVSVLYHKQFSQNSSLNPVVHGLSVALGTVKWRLKIEALGKIRYWQKR